MPPPELPLELLLMIARRIRDDHGELHYGGFNSFLQINRALHRCLNLMLWKEAGKHEIGTQRVLTHLIETNNPAGLKFFLELGADINLEVRLPAIDMTGFEADCDQVGEFGIELDIEPIPLLIVVHLDNVPMARLLLEHGAEVEYFDEDDESKFSPIHAARSAEMVQLLLDHDADPDLEDDFERRPLHWYAIRDNITAIRAILQHGAEINPDGPHGNPLSEAAPRNLHTVELLVEHGADVQQREAGANTPLHFAASAGKTDVVKFLVERWPEGMRATNEHGETPLHLAAEAEKTDMVKFLAEQWPEAMREKDLGLDTILHRAAGYGWRSEMVGSYVEGWPDVEVLRLLVEGWPEAIREKNQYGQTPLHGAATTGKAEVMRFLVERWPEAKEELDTEGDTPLSAFERYGSCKPHVSDTDKVEIVALLGGAHSEAGQ
jgi:ankyrin repeat protein